MFPLTYVWRTSGVRQTDRGVSFIRFAPVKLTYHGGVYISGLAVFVIDIKDNVYFVNSVKESLRHNDLAFKFHMLSKSTERCLLKIVYLTVFSCTLFKYYFKYKSKSLIFQWYIPDNLYNYLNKNIIKRKKNIFYDKKNTKREHS